MSLLLAPPLLPMIALIAICSPFRVAGGVRSAPTPAVLATLPLLPPSCRVKMAWSTSAEGRAGGDPFSSSTAAVVRPGRGDPAPPTQVYRK